VGAGVLRALWVVGVLEVVWRPLALKPRDGGCGEGAVATAPSRWKQKIRASTHIPNGRHVRIRGASVFNFRTETTRSSLGTWAVFFA